MTSSWKMVMLSIPKHFAGAGCASCSFLFMSFFHCKTAAFFSTSSVPAKSPRQLEQSHQAIFIGEQTIPLKFFPAGVWWICIMKSCTWTEQSRKQMSSSDRNKVMVVRTKQITIWNEYLSGQIIATSHDLTPNRGLVREIPLFQGNLGWWNIIIWPVFMNPDFLFFVLIQILY